MNEIVEKFKNFRNINQDKIVANTSALSRRNPFLFLTVFYFWFLSIIWFSPRLYNVVISAADGFVSQIALCYFALFIILAWLYGIYNIVIVIFASLYNPKTKVLIDKNGPAVSILYTTCNDFNETSALSCCNLDYKNFTVYILDDSTDATYKSRIDKFASNHQNVIVIRRPLKTGFKAGNLNYALQHFATQPYFVIADADEILPGNFLSALVPQLENNPECGFIQANHRCASSGNSLQRDMKSGIDIHWDWYQPLRNKFGFVMFLGHGALLRRSCWEEVDGFPNIVSEDLAYAIAIREKGYTGIFNKEVICLEDFPDSVRKFRIRHVKWTRGTCEFLHKFALKLIKSKNISLVEKLDILFPTANLPLTLFFFMFMIVTAIVLPVTIGERSILTIETIFGDALLPVTLMPSSLYELYTFDFYAITIATILGPILCFIMAMWRTPLKLIKFLANSTALYATLSPLSSLCVLGYFFTRKARFLVTGDNFDTFRSAFWSETHPDSTYVRIFEIVIALLFFTAALFSFQIALFGLAFGYALLAIMHKTDWQSNTSIQYLSWVPFTFIVISIMLGGVGLFGIQPIFFGFGFHF